MSSKNFPLVLTLDIGTTSARALAFDSLGRRVPDIEGRAPTPVQTTTDGGASLDPMAAIEATAACIDMALAQLGARATNVVAVACDTFWHNILGLDTSDQPVTPLLTWADTRPAAVIPELSRRLDPDAYHSRTGCFIHPSYVPAKILWLTQRAPSLRVAHWLSLGEWLQYEFLGERAIGVSMASGSGLFDVNRQTWDEPTLAAIGVTPDHLSPLRNQRQPMQGLRPKWAARWPTLANVPWTLPIGDGAASNLGCGATTPDRLAVMIGTSAVMRVVLASDRRPATKDDSQPSTFNPQSSVSVPPGLWAYRADEQRVLVGGALSNGGNLFAWLQDTLRLPEGEALEQAVAAMQPDAHGLTWLPFLAGERSTGWRADAKATLSGMTWATTPLDIYRAGLEIVALRLALIYDRLRAQLPPQHTAIATGGALLASPTLCSIVADALGQPLVVSTEAEASARGAAILALEALNLTYALDTLPVALGATVEPDPARHTVYRAALERHQALYDKLLGG